ncbi:heme ABC transporter ATP-binding protein [Aquisalimonas lutea]|uniref:heme ABC transporter ATP-binding protein n=1 Tax=Aquisalimonas lutea TaxID=1327750 RepID=UPI0025B39BFD|nr:heme ABC transporter ATP-binding protein [Aquisalimonas lutea]MDN3518697.1 heme ABC transporter ATP-binding protein [Aquisalimonas lutea]
MLAAADIHVRRAGRRLLTGVRVCVEPGETVALIGPNGAGKSTLLHVLSGAIRPDYGSVTLNRTPLTALDDKEVARHRAVLPQTPELGFPLTVRDVVALGRSPHAGRSSRSADARIIAAAMDETGIGHLRHRLYPTLSGGERQRVHLARVLAQVADGDDQADGRGRYLLLDEPTNNLDIAHQQHAIETGLRFSRRGNGVVVVLHDPNLAAGYADRIVVLVGGAVLTEGPPEAVVTEELLREAFGVRAMVHRNPSSGRPFMVPNHGSSAMTPDSRAKSQRSSPCSSP